MSPSSSHAERSPAPKIRVKRDTAATGTTQHITEVFASTKPYPSWWSEIEEHRVFRKHKSMGDAVLERNVCFVDTPGFSRETSATELVLQYIEDQLSKTFSSTSMTERDIVSMLSGYGGTQVDLVLYMISQGILCIHQYFSGSSILIDFGFRHQVRGSRFLASPISVYQRRTIDC